MRAAAKTALGLLPDQATSGVAETENGSRYLLQLCKHWSHKAEATFDQSTGKVVFDDGQTIEMSAHADNLAISLTAGPRSDLERWKSVVEAHLKRFAHREDFQINWSD
nr:DUF2218 domain-containing protein [Ruegeria sp. EL01]